MILSCYFLLAKKKYTTKQTNRGLNNGSLTHITHVFGISYLNNFTIRRLTRTGNTMIEKSKTQSNFCVTANRKETRLLKTLFFPLVSQRFYKTQCIQIVSEIMLLVFNTIVLTNNNRC